MSSLLGGRSSARHQRRMQLRSFSPYSWSRNPSTVERWACGESAVGAAGCVAFGSGSMCRWRRSAVVRIPAFRAGDRDGRNAATRGRNGIRNAVSGATRRRPRRRAGRQRQTWHRRWSPITKVVKLSRGCLKPRAMGRDSVRRSWTIAAGRQISLRQERPCRRVLDVVGVVRSDAGSGLGICDGSRTSVSDGIAVGGRITGRTPSGHRRGGGGGCCPGGSVASSADRADRGWRGVSGVAGYRYAYPSFDADR